MRKDTLENGVRVVTEYMPYVRSVSTGIWVNAGASHEKAELGGVSHFLEHNVVQRYGKKNVKRDCRSF